jgi:AcrR family transcriptional regulator
MGDREAPARPAAESSRPPAEPSGAASGVRERILAVACDLFALRGVRGVGINKLIGRAGVAKATFYRDFASKEELVRAFLARRDQQWTVDSIISGARRRAESPDVRLAN